jgi:hypothetical protein
MALIRTSKQTNKQTNKQANRKQFSRKFRINGCGNGMAMVQNDIYSLKILTILR